MAASKWHILASIFLDSGTEFVSGNEVHLAISSPAESRIYEGRALAFGTIERSITSPIGLPSISDAKIRLADTDFKLRTLLAHQTPRRRMLSLKIVEDGTSESAVEPSYTGEIGTPEYGPGYVDIPFKDRTFAWIDETIPNRITRANFPDLPQGIDEAFLPYIFGRVESHPDNPQGVIELPRLSASRFGLAAHTVFDVIAIYRKLPGEGASTIVDPGDFDVTVEATNLDGVSTDCTFIDFLLDQDEGTEVRADVAGLDSRPAWGTLPAIVSGGSPAGELRNPIDTFINISFMLLTKFGGEANFDTDHIIEIREQFETVITAPSGALPYLCDGAVTESITGRALLGRFLPCFQLDMFQDRGGLIDLNFTFEEDAGRPVFSDGQDIEQDSFFESGAGPTFNQIRFRYMLTNATGEWAGSELFDNDDDQATLGEIEPDIVDLFFVRDFATAQDVIARRASFLALGSYRQEFVVPFPEVKDELELAAQVGLSTPWGLETGGYSNREAKILGITVDLDTLKATVRTILRVPQEVIPPVLIDSGEITFDMTFDGEATGTLIS